MQSIVNLLRRKDLQTGWPSEVDNRVYTHDKPIIDVLNYPSPTYCRNGSWMPLSPAAICRCTETMADWGMAKLTGILGRLRAQDVKVRHPLLRVPY